jgi:alkylated DNA repair dioxygenase AlkB
VPVHWQRIDLDDGAWLDLAQGVVASAETQALFAALMAEVPFAQRPIRIFGRDVMQPRLTAWMGEPVAVYTYSGTRHVPAPFGPVMSALRERVCEATGERFNSVLCNLYRNGTDAMGMHSDSEPELGELPVIASLSLGATRRFTLRHRVHKQRGVELALENGSLLVMRGTTQRFYKHGVPREPKVQLPRINLTFRRVRPR